MKEKQLYCHELILNQFFLLLLGT